MSGLDAEQDAVKHAPMGPLMVVAGAGTGKTRALTHRVAHLTASGLDPNRVLLVTFTQKAAREMAARITELNPQSAPKWIGTFHAIAARILRNYADRFGYTSDFGIIEPSRCRTVMTSVLAAHGTSASSELSPESLLRANSLSVNTNRPLQIVMQSISGLSRVSPELIDQLLVDYLVAKIERNVMDYDDLLLYWDQLMRSDAVARQEISGAFDAVFVDEYQDVNPLQTELLERLVEPHGNLMVVGDHRQSIYGFRGSDVAAMSGFLDRYPHANVLHLSTNYRSSAQIVELANRTMAGEGNALKAKRSASDEPVCQSFSTAIEQAQFVGRQLQHLLDYGVPPHEMAVLYRTHAQSRVIELALSEMGIKYRVRSGRRLSERRHVRPLLDIFSMVAQPDNPTNWPAGMSHFPGIGLATIGELLNGLERDGGLVQWLESPSGHSTAGGRNQYAVERMRTQLAEIWQRSTNGQISVALEALVQAVLKPWIETKFPLDAAERLADLEAISVSARRYTSMVDFLNALVLAGEDDDDDGFVVLSTVHRAKGLEWAAVFVVGLYEGGFPLGLAFGSPSGLAEEQRLFYVAVTRAQRWLYLCHPWQEDDRGMTQTPSRFITSWLLEADELPEHARAHEVPQ